MEDTSTDDSLRAEPIIGPQDPTGQSADENEDLGHADHHSDTGQFLYILVLIQLIISGITITRS